MGRQSHTSLLLELLLLFAVSVTNREHAEAANATGISVGVLVPMHGGNGEELGDFFRQFPACAIMAAYHVNNRVPAIVPDAQQLLPEGFTMIVDLRDSRWSAAVAVERAIEWNDEGQHAIIGSLRSAVSGPLALAASVENTPVISWASSSSSLSDKETYPYFSRTFPSDGVLARSMVQIVAEFGWLRIGVIYVSDAYGSAFVEDLTSAAQLRGVEIAAFQKFFSGETETVDLAVAAVANSGVHVIVCIAFDPDMPAILDAAEQRGILGEGFVWLGGESFTPSEIVRASADPEGRALQLRGWFQVLFSAWDGDTQSRVEQALLSVPPTEWDHPIFANREPPLRALPPQEPCAYIYDAVWLAAIAASRSAADGAGGPEKGALLQEIRKATFTGASARVELDRRTGDRLPEGLPVTVRNVRPAAGASGVERPEVWRWRGGELSRVGAVPPVWGGGEQQWEQPPIRADCAGNTVFSQSTLRCEPCPRGSNKDAYRCVPFDASIGVLIPLSDPSGAPLAVGAFFKRFGAVALMAVRHVNSRINVLVPEAKALLPEGFRMVADIQDSFANPSSAVKSALAWNEEDRHVIVGSAFSSVTGPLSLAAAIGNTPVIAWGATSSQLSDDTLFPVLSRTVPTDRVLASGIAQIVKQLGWSRIAVVYINDEYGRAFGQELIAATSEWQVEVSASAAFFVGDPASLDAALEVLKESGARVFVAIFSPAGVEAGVEAAARHGLVGRGYTWITDNTGVSGLLQEAEDPGLVLQRITGWWIAEIVSMPGTQTARFTETLTSEPPLDHPLIDVTNAELAELSAHPFSAYVYDAVWLAALAVQNATRSAEGVVDKGEVLRNIRSLRFQGASGEVNLDAAGDRAVPGTTVQMRNLARTLDADGEPALLDRIVFYWTADSGLSRQVPDDEPPFWYDLEAFGGREEEARGWTAPPDGSSCGAGTVFDDAPLACVPCAAGSFQSGSQCELCPPGSVAPLPGSVGCTACSEGFAPTTGMSECLPCPANTARRPASPGVNVTECDPRFSRAPLVVIAQASDAGVSRCVCLLDFFSAEGAGNACEACVTGAKCDGGTSLPYPLPQYWGMKDCVQYGGDVDCEHAEGGEVVRGWLSFLPCPVAENCLGGPDFACKDGTQNRRCFQAEPGWTIIGTRWYLECNDHGALWTVLGIVAVVVVWFGINHLASGQYVALNVGLLFVQCTALMSQYQLGWHEDLNDLRLLLFVLNFDVDFVTPMCLVDWGPVQAFALQLSVPFILGGCSVAGQWIQMCWRRWKGTEDDEEGTGRRMWKVALKNTVNMCLIVYTTVCMKCFEVFRCFTYPDNHQYMLFHPQVKCWEGQHWFMVVLAGVYIPVVLLGLPVLIAMVLRHHMAKGTLHSESATWEWDFLHAAYEADYKWWELMLLLRRFALSFILIAVTEPLLQAAATIMVLTGLLAAHSYTRPYIAQEVDALDFAGLCCSILYMIAGMLFYPSVTGKAQGVLCQGGEESLERCASNYAVKDAVSAATLAAVSLTLAVSGGLALYLVRERRQSAQASKLIREGIYERIGSASERAGSCQRESANKLRLDEVLDGSLLLRWAKRQDSNATARQYLTSERDINSLQVDLTEYSTDATAVLLRQLCEVEGLLDYLCWEGARGVQQLFAFVEDMVFFTERSEETHTRHKQPTFPVHDMTKFEFRPVLAYWLMATRNDVRHGFMAVLREIEEASGRVYVPINHLDSPSQSFKASHRRLPFLPGPESVEHRSPFAEPGPFTDIASATVSFAGGPELRRGPVPAALPSDAIDAPGEPPSPPRSVSIDSGPEHVESRDSSRAKVMASAAPVAGQARAAEAEAVEVAVGR